MKVREDYESSLSRRFIHWVNGDPIEDDQDSHIHLLKTKEEIKEHRHQRNTQRNENIKKFYNDHIEKIYDYTHKIISVLLTFFIIAVLLVCVSDMPKFGDISNPVNNEVSDRYIHEGLEETGAVNIVAGMILDYRAFDTLGESHVLFIAAASVLILLKLNYDKDGHLDSHSEIKDEGYDREFEPKYDSILQSVTRILFPIMVLYGIYVILNGHISAGGGFSGGAIVGAALILYNNAFGFKATKRFFTYNTFKWVSFASLMTYASLKVYSFFTGANHIASIIPLGKAGAILSSGLILPLNICVGCVVACTMYTFFTMFRKGGM